MKLADIVAGLIATLFLLIILAILISYARKLWLKTRFRMRYRSEGRFILFVYSDSPHWKDYIESNILPRIGSCSVTLNWSERKKWGAQSPFEARVFKRWAGDREFNPVAIIFPPRGKVKVIRFWQAFRDYKHGKPNALKKAEEELFREANQFAGKAV